MNCQQGALYDAESLVLMAGNGNQPVTELQAYVDELRDLTWWERNFPQVLRVEAYHRPASFTGGSVGKWIPERGCGHIEMASCHLVELYVLHEVSHVLTTARYGRNAHGPWFARTYLELIYAKLGSEAYAALRASFDDAGVDHDADSAVPAGVQL